jgi:hypothetical protein
MVTNHDDEIRAAIDRLYDLYLRVRNTPEGSGGRIAQSVIAKKLHDELIRLGVTEDRYRQIAASVLEAAEAVARVRLAEPKDPQAIDLKDHRADAKDIIRESTTTANIELSAGGRQMLTIPLMEYYRLSHEWNRNEIQSSVGKIFETLRMETAKEGTREKSSIDIIRSFSKNFCNIPPFCRRNIEGIEK